LKVRKAVAVTLISLGLAISVLGLLSWVAGAHSPLILTVTIILGAFFFVAGVLIFITERFESWLSNGQAALVDGLQAG
jgi:uncharacterized membrane protein